MSYGLAFGFPRNNTLAAAASPFAQLGPTLDLVFTGVGSSGDPTANDSLDLNFVGDTYSVAAPYMVWGSTGMTAENFQDIVTFSRATGNATYYNSSGYLTTAGVWNYLTYSNVFDNAAWAKSASFIQTNLLIWSQQFDDGNWTKQNVTVTANQVIAPDGTLTADLVVPSATDCSIRESFVPSVAANHTFSVWLRSATGGSFDTTIRISRATPFVSIANVVVTVTPTWTRFNLTAATLDTTVHECWVGGGSTLSTGEDFYAWGAQLVQGSVPGDYRATTTTTLPILYPDYTGALRARKLCENNASSQHITSNTIAIPANSLLSNSIYLKAGERTSVRLINYDAASNYAFAYINLATGTFHSTGTTGTVTSPAFAITPAGDGWYRVSVVASLAATFRMLYLNIVTGTSTDSYTGDGSSGVYIADAQINDGSSALPYYDTTQYPYYAPRFDYDPVTLAAKGLLVEEQRANLLLQSNDFQTSWGVTNITRTLNSILSPEGVVNGVKIEATGVAATTVLQAATVAATSATGSVYVKQGTSATVANSFVLKNGTTATNLIAGTLNYSTGVFTYSIGSTGVVVTNVGNGWWRIAITATTGITSGDSIQWFVGWGGAIATAGDFLYAYGAQLEAGASATSYIPTTTSQLTRAADVASVNTLSPWFNAATGTIYTEADTFEPSSLSVRNAIAINDGTTNNLHRVLSYTGKIGGNTSTAGSFVADLQPLTYTTNTTFKFAYAYATNDFVAVGNGGAPSTDTSGALPTGLTTMGLGNLTGVFWCGHLRRITYYPRRLPNADLQTLTTL